MPTGPLVPVGTMSFLAGDGEMARRIRDHDWSDHPFGPPETWPQSLRSALSICLNSAFPTAIYWGPELRLLYNDAWAPIPGPRHPEALGAPAKTVWADIWHVIGPQFDKILSTGSGLYVENQMLPMRRYGSPEETYWSYSFTPIRGEDGTIAGIFNSGSETTQTVLSQRQMALMLELSEVLRAEPDAESGRRAAMAMLGRRLCVERVGFAEFGNAERAAKVVEEWNAPGVAPTADFDAPAGCALFVERELAAGRAVRIDDVRAHPEVRTGEIEAVLAPLGIGAVVAVPWLEGGRIAGFAYLHAAGPRAWSDFDISTLDGLIQRTRGWLGEQRAEQRERIMIREIDHRARNVLAIALSVVRLTDAEDIAEFREKIEERITALAKAHGLLAGERWSDIELEKLLDEELAPYAGDSGRVRRDGPAVPLPPELTQTVALVLHELATNAAKHGALGSPDGVLTVRWRIGSSGRLEIDWTESGLDLRQGDAPRTGFGTTLLERIVEAQLGGTIERTFTDTGLVCRIAIPLAAEGFEPARPARRAGPGRILIAEDEAIIAMDLEMAVEDLGYGIFATCSSLAEGLTAIEEATPDLAILDKNLRGQSSIPLAEQLHARGVPLIFATGYQALSDLPPALKGAPRLAKPVDAQELADAIRKLLGDD